jgi:hypothetical protein
MQKVLIREMAIYVILLVVLAFLMHPDLLVSPQERIGVMDERGNWAHPFIYTFLIYSILFFVRFVVKKVIQLLNKLKSQ